MQGSVGCAKTRQGLANMCFFKSPSITCFFFGPSVVHMNGVRFVIVQYIKVQTKNSGPLLRCEDINHYA
jgi:hypothetical protein